LVGSFDTLVVVSIAPHSLSLRLRFFRFTGIVSPYYQTVLTNTRGAVCSPTPKHRTLLELVKRERRYFRRCVSIVESNQVIDPARTGGGECAVWTLRQHPLFNRIVPVWTRSLATLDCALPDTSPLLIDDIEAT
jgi:hypothetical protein